jgi:hypothetical protein
MAGGRASGPASEKGETNIQQRKNSTQYEDGEDDEDYIDSDGNHAFRVQEEFDGGDVDVIGNTPKPYQGTTTLDTKIIYAQEPEQPSFLTDSLPCQ